MNFLRVCHQRCEGVNIFGFLPSRFLYESGPEAHHVPDDEVSAAEKEAKNKYAEFTDILQTGVTDYNGRYTNEPRPDDNNYYKELNLDLNDLPGFEKQVYYATVGLLAKNGKMLRIDLNDHPQMQALVLMERYVKLIQQVPAVARESLEYAHRGRLARRHEQMIKVGETRELWKKTKGYGEVQSAFDSLANSKEFKGAWQSPDGLTTPNQREARELFLALMAEKTRGFKDTWVLGENFQDDPEANIRNFPFIYNEFLKHEGTLLKLNVSLEGIAEATSKAEEADKGVASLGRVEDIITGVTDAVISVSELGPLPTTTTEGWNNRKDALRGMVIKLREQASNEPEPYLRKKVWETAANKLEAYRVHADKHLHLSSLRDREAELKSRFVRTELDQTQRLPLVIGWAMKQFMKAKETVDLPIDGKTSWQQTLHPTVRRMLIASIYERGVATYDTDKNGARVYQADLKPENVWMIANLSLSNYFNRREIGEHMDADHELILKAAYLSSRISVLLEKTKEVEGLLEAWMDVLVKHKDRSLTTQTDRKAAMERMGIYPPVFVKQYSKYTLADIEGETGVLAILKKDQKTLNEFLERTKSAIRRPYDAKSIDFIKDMKAGRYQALNTEVSRLAELGIVTGADLKAYETQMYDLQINFKTAELQDKNSLQFFRGLGMNIEAAYQAYVNATEKQPNLKREHWDMLLMGTEAQYGQLRNLFVQILPPSAAGGKEDFLVALDSIRKKYKDHPNMTHVLSHLQEGSEEAVALNVFKALQLHLSNRETTAAASDLQEKEVKARLDGMHVGDKVSKYAHEIWDMLAGPGQSPVNRAAGFVLIYVVYKAASKAMKGTDTTSKALRALLVATSVEMVAKKMGRGILDRTGLDSVAGAMEGTYEAVMLQDAKTHMDAKDITPEAHAAALHELNDVPFNQVLAWYESSDPNGMPRTKGSRDIFPKKINRRKIGEKVTWKEKNRDMEARRVVYEAVRHFFGYVGAKDNKHDALHGKKALKERWVTMIDNPNHNPQYTPYTHMEAIKAGNLTKKDITWRIVMRSEIDDSEVDLTKNKALIPKLTETVSDVAVWASEWAREFAYYPLSGYAKDFFQNCGEAAQDMKKFFSEVVQLGERKIYFGKEKVIFWWGEHQYEIKRTAENHWKLLVTATKLPFQVILAADNATIPWTLAKLRELEEILKSNQTVYDTKSLDSSHIVSDMAFLGSDNRQTNKEFRYFGLYQEPFLRALTKDPLGDMTGTVDTSNKTGDLYYEELTTRVGYYITKMDLATAKIKKDDPSYANDPANVDSNMFKKSRDQAVKFFMKKAGLNQQLVGKYLYPVHRVRKTNDSEAMYVFWRMPLKDSAEFNKKEAGLWTDYEDPLDHKDRKPFEVDPSQTTWENLQRAFALDTGSIRGVGRVTGKYAAQVPRFSFGVVSVAGDILKSIGRKAGWGRDFEHAVDLATKRDESTKQMVDEVFGSASDKNSALSEFYKNEDNATLFEFSSEFAEKTGRPRYLGLLKDRPNYEGTYYLKQPDPQVYNDMWKYYKNHYQAVGKADPTIEAELNRHPPTTP